jgi:hypothetical protein
MSIAFQMQDSQKLFKSIACTIMFSSPHSHINSQDGWQNALLILRKYSKSKVKHTITHEVAAALTEDCYSFEKIFDQIPILTVFETKETRVGPGGLKKELVSLDTYSRIDIRADL